MPSPPPHRETEQGRDPLGGHRGWPAEPTPHSPLPCTLQLRLLLWRRERLGWRPPGPDRGRPSRGPCSQASCLPEALRGSPRPRNAAASSLQGRRPRPRQPCPNLRSCSGTWQPRDVRPEPGHAAWHWSRCVGRRQAPAPGRGCPDKQHTRVQPQSTGTGPGAGSKEAADGRPRGGGPRVPLPTSAHTAVPSGQVTASTLDQLRASGWPAGWGGRRANPGQLCPGPGFQGSWEELLARAPWGGQGGRWALGPWGPGEGSFPACTSCQAAPRSQPAEPPALPPGPRPVDRGGLGAGDSSGVCPAPAASEPGAGAQGSAACLPRGRRSRSSSQRGPEEQGPGSPGLHWLRPAKEAAPRGRPPALCYGLGKQ
ncbi:translation initiation factor IF-2 [Oryctolagus cuniculus]|uniref:translation initiation factor IF-2 n=1 Tax=Oryctolagus cuniculus TaxID=9986 RepID=UPI0038795581